MRTLSKENFLHTKICDILGIQYPIVQAGMGGTAYAELAAAVSNAGGLGTIAAVSLSADDLDAEIRKVRKLTSKPFCVNVGFPRELVEMSPETRERLAVVPSAAKERLREWKNWITPGMLDRQMEVIIEHKVPVVSSALGNPAKYLDALHAYGAKVMANTGTVHQARRTAEAGVDIVIAAGYEGGGHTGRIGTMALIPQVVDAVSVPVLAAGGIGLGRSLVAALVLGASGVWVGTRFLMTEESGVHAGYKQRVLAAGEDDTVVTKAFTGKTLRAIKNRYTEEWKRKENEIEPFPFQFISAGRHWVAGFQEGDTEWGAISAGQICGAIHKIKPADEVLRDLVEEAVRVFNEEIYNR